MNGLLAAAIKPGKNTATETAYKTALSIITQMNIRALKTLHVYSLKATELDRLAEINKANGRATITRPTRLKTQQDNPRYKHCYYLN